MAAQLLPRDRSGAAQQSTATVYSNDEEGHWTIYIVSSTIHYIHIVSSTRPVFAAIDATSHYTLWTSEQEGFAQRLLSNMTQEIFQHHAQ